jgi:hypothetical protein
MACIVVFGAELLGYLETGVRILLQEAKEVFALYEIDLAGVHSLGGQFVGLAGNRGAEPQHFSRFDNLKDKRLAIPSAEGELHLPLAKHEDTARCLAFHEQDRALRIGGRILDPFKSLQRRRAQVAEDAACPHLAGKTTFTNIESVW